MSGGERETEWDIVYRKTKTMNTVKEETQTYIRE